VGGVFQGGLAQLADGVDLVSTGAAELDPSYSAVITS
jgi:hypothetical protein